jgi:hypothetical protein
LQTGFDYARQVNDLPLGQRRDEAGFEFLALCSAFSSIALVVLVTTPWSIADFMFSVSYAPGRVLPAASSARRYSATTWWQSPRSGLIETSDCVRQDPQDQTPVFTGLSESLIG